MVQGHMVMAPGTQPLLSAKPIGGVVEALASAEVAVGAEADLVIGSRLKSVVN